MPLRRLSVPLASAALLIPLIAAGAAVGASPGVVDDPPTHSADDAAVTLTALGTHRTGQFDVSAAEIVAFHAATARTFVVNAQSGHVDVLDASDPTAPEKIATLDVAGTTSDDGSTIPGGAVVNSLDIRADGLAVVAVESPTKTDPGWLAFVDVTSLDVLGAVRLGALPDMVELTADGSRAVVANEGEPDDDFEIDPEGSVSVVDLPGGVEAAGQSAVRTADFHAFEADGTKTLPADVRIFGPEVNTEYPVSANLEPEYIAVDGNTAYAALQEANAVAVIDLDAAEVTDIWPLGAKDHSRPGSGLDPSDRDGGIDIGTWPVKGLYMPDGIVSYKSGGRTYLVTANEGDAREWGDYVEPARVKDLGDDGLAPVCDDSPAADALGDDALGRLNVTTASGLDEDRGCYDELYSFGARSFSIWTTDGDQVYDSGEDYERVTAAAAPDYFNSNHSESNLEGRSEDKGPEPENLAIGEVGGRTYAFVGLERVGGIVVHDITTPGESRFVTYLNNRDFAVSVEDTDDPNAVLDDAGDLGPEGVAFIAADDSPNGTAMLAVGNEVSGTTTFFAVGAEFTSTAAPTIEGKPVVGEELTATVAAWAPVAEFTYQWLRDGKPIDGATHATYAVRPADAGADLTVEVTGTASGITPQSRTSEPVTIERGSESTLTIDLDVERAAVGDDVAVAIDGAAAGEKLSMELHSDPVSLGSVTANASGAAAATFAVPEVSAGRHTVVVQGPSGVAEATLIVTAAAGSASDGDDEVGSGGLLPDAGAPAVLALLAAALAVTATGVVLLRRQTAAERE